MIMNQGRIVKNYMGYYYVETAMHEIITCKVKGKMKQNRFSLCTGDYVKFEVSGSEGMITDILPRKNFLLRPTVANIDLVVVTVSCSNPDFSFLITDKLLALAEIARIPGIICLTKVDIAPAGLVEKCCELYEKIGYKVFLVSAKEGIGIEELRAEVSEKLTVFAGPSGVGKSSTLNAIDPNLNLVTGQVSEKIGRGRHTTRFAHFIPFAGGYLADTPGFGNLTMEEIEANALPQAFREFVKYAHNCRFSTCSHTHEPNCAVKEAVEAGEIDETRYVDYLQLLKQVKERKDKRYG